MTHQSYVQSREMFMGSLPLGSDLLEGLTEVCSGRKVTLGRIEAIGAVQSARIGFYNQETRTYQFLSLDMPLEIVNLVGNVSLKDGKSFVHAHISLADDKGVVHGGHLAPGTRVFACEFVIEAFDGAQFERGYDEKTGLPLWSK